MYTRNGSNTGSEPSIRLIEGVHTGLVLFGVLLFGVGLLVSLGASGVIDPGLPSFDDGDENETPADDAADDAEVDDADDGDGADEPEEADGEEEGSDDGDGADGADGDDAADADDADDADGADDAESDDEDVAEPDTAPITITAVDPVGNPIEDVDVRGEGEPHEADIPLEFEGETDSDGTYSGEIYENEYAIELDHPDYEGRTVEHTHDGESELTVELEPENAPDASMVTIVVTDEDGEPIENATVSGEGEPHEADIPLEFEGETNANGEYADVIYENEYTVEVDHPDYEGIVGRYTHEGEQEVRVQLEADD